MSTATNPLLSDKVIVVTGAGRGIGRAVSLLAAREGARLALVDLGCDVEGQGADPSVVAGVASELASVTDVMTSASDVTSSASVEALVSDVVARFGRIDGVVHAAGVVADRSVLRTTDDDLDRVLGAQLRAAFALTRFAGQAMVDRKEGGSIVLCAGGSAFFGARGHAAMGAAQAGVVALARSAALELRRHRVRVNAIVPSARTRQTESLPTFASIDPASMSPEHVAALVVFLLSDLAEGVHGEAIGVAGSRAYAIRARETTGAFGPPTPADPRSFAESWSDVLKP